MTATFRPESDQPVIVSEPGQPDPALNPQLSINLMEMRFHRPLGQREGLGDLRIIHSPGAEPHHLQLSRGERPSQALRASFSAQEVL